VARSLDEGRVILLHDNAWQHTVGIASQELIKFGWEVLERPPYSPDLLLCNFHVFGELKKSLKGQHFSSDNEIQEVVMDTLRQLLQSFYKDTINRLVRQ
jgi:transposase